MTYAFLVFYQFKTMSADETKRATAGWQGLKKHLPQGVRLAGEYDHAWGTEYNGFLLFEAEDSDSFLDWWSSFRDKVRWYVTKTHTVVSRKR